MGKILSIRFCVLLSITSCFLSHVSIVKGDSQGNFNSGMEAFAQSKYDIAASKWKISAAEGHLRAQNGLGVLYRDGLGVEKNPEKALYWFGKSASNGYAFGMYNLALFLISEKIGQSQLRIEAYKWLYLAASLNFDEKVNYELYSLGSLMNPEEKKSAVQAAQVWFDRFFFGL